MRQAVIHLHPLAPPKPPVGQPCNGCGVCCAYAPCPLGMLLSLRMRGACRALRWDSTQARYRCGVVAEPRRHFRWLPAALVRRLALRWIAAARGCDAALDPG